MGASWFTSSGVVVLDCKLVLRTLRHTLSGIKVSERVISVVIFEASVNAHIDNVICEPFVGQATILVACLVLYVAIELLRAFGYASVGAQMRKVTGWTELHATPVYCLTAWQISELIHR